MNKARQYFEEETKGMSLEDKLKWIQETIFYIEMADYIQDKESWNTYYDIKHELEELLKNRECCMCESQYIDYKIDGKYYCENCAWELAKELDMDVDDDTVTIYKIGEKYIEDDREEAIECAFDYLNMKIEKV